MALASQNARGQRIPSSSVAVYRAKRRARTRVVAGVAALVLLGGGGLLWLLWNRDSGNPIVGPQNAQAAPDPLGATPVASQPKPEIRPEPKPEIKPEPKTAPAEFTMGASRAQEPAASLAAPLPTAMPQTETAGAGAQPGAVRDPLVSTGTPGATTPPPAETAPATPTRAGLPSDLNTLVESAERAQRDGKLVECRNLLNRVLLDQRTPETERPALRRWMSELSDVLVFSPTAAAGDPFSQVYSVVSGDSLPVINRKLGLTTEYMLIARVNRLSDPGKIQIGQKLKVANGPFHAVVSKSAFRMDLYVGDPPSPSSVGTASLACGAEPGWVYVRSFMVGLGADNGTPIANFVVKNGSKLVNPFWRNPRTGETFQPEDPKNPIGERWVGLEGFDEASKAHTGFGVHGTVEPESIGRSMSMGCIRLGTQDVELVYELLAPKVSVVKVVP